MRLKVIVIFLLLYVSVVSAEGLSYTFTTDNKFSGTESLSQTGYVELHLSNTSEQFFGFTFLRLREGKTLEDYQAAMQGLMTAFGGDGDVAAAFANLYATSDTIGGMDAPPGSSGEIGVLLRAGTYVVNGVCHDCEETQQLLTLTVSEGTHTEAPTPDLKLDMADFRFDGLPSEIEAGEHLWEIANTGVQGHFMALLKLAEGKTLEDVMTYLNSPEGQANENPPPSDISEAVGESSFLTGGQRYFQRFDLAPGEYVVVCPIPDSASGTPHYHLGMVQTLTVK